MLCLCDDLSWFILVFIGLASQTSATRNGDPSWILSLCIRRFVHILHTESLAQDWTAWVQLHCTGKGVEEISLKMQQAWNIASTPLLIDNIILCFSGFECPRRHDTQQGWGWYSSQVPSGKDFHLLLDVEHRCDPWTHRQVYLFLYLSLFYQLKVSIHLSIVIVICVTSRLNKNCLVSSELWWKITWEVMKVNFLCRRLQKEAATPSLNLYLIATVRYCYYSVVNRYWSAI